MSAEAPDPTAAPEGTPPAAEPELTGVFNLVNRLRERRIGNLERDVERFGHIGGAALADAGIELPEVLREEGLPRYQTPQGRGERKAEEALSGHADALKDATAEAQQFEHGTALLDRVQTRVPATSEWVKSERAKLRTELQRGRINKSQHDREVKELKEKKPKRWLKIFPQPYAHVHFRPRERESNPVRVERMYRAGDRVAAINEQVDAIDVAFHAATDTSEQDRLLEERQALAHERSVLQTGGALDRAPGIKIVRQDVPYRFEEDDGTVRGEGTISVPVMYDEVRDPATGKVIDWVRSADQPIIIEKMKRQVKRGDDHLPVIDDDGRPVFAVIRTGEPEILYEGSGKPKLVVNRVTPRFVEPVPKIDAKPGKKAAKRAADLKQTMTAVAEQKSRRDAIETLRSKRGKTAEHQAAWNRAKQQAHDEAVAAYLRQLNYHKNDWEDTKKVGRGVAKGVRMTGKYGWRATKATARGIKTHADNSAIAYEEGLTGTNPSESFIQRRIINKVARIAGKATTRISRANKDRGDSGGVVLP